jgi:hypothetical protein
MLRPSVSTILQQEFEEQGSEIETAARECIAADFEAIAKAYGFEDADVKADRSTRMVSAASQARRSSST